MGRSRRDTRVYELKDGRQIVYFGITNNPDRRLSEHVKSDKEFTHMNLVSPKLSRKSAESMEAKKSGDTITAEVLNSTLGKPAET